MKEKLLIREILAREFPRIAEPYGSTDSEMASVENCRTGLTPRSDLSRSFHTSTSVYITAAHPTELSQHGMQIPSLRNEIISEEINSVFISGIYNHYQKLYSTIYHIDS